MAKCDQHEQALAMIQEWLSLFVRLSVLGHHACNCVLMDLSVPLGGLCVHLDVVMGISANVVMHVLLSVVVFVLVHSHAGYHKLLGFV